MSILSHPVGIQAYQVPVKSSGSDLSLAEDKANVGFSSVLKNVMEGVSQEQKNAEILKKEFEMGNPNVSIVDVSLQEQKASLAFEGLVRVRKEMIRAYQEVMRMQF